MTQQRIDKLNWLVADAREPMPTYALFTEAVSVSSREWIPRVVGGEWCWQPRHDYTGDDAAMLLFDELPEAVLYAPSGDFQHYTVTAHTGVENIRRDRMASTRRVAIVLAWLAWRGVEVEVAE